MEQRVERPDQGAVLSGQWEQPRTVSAVASDDPVVDRPLGVVEPVGWQLLQTLVQSVTSPSKASGVHGPRRRNRGLGAYFRVVAAGRSSGIDAVDPGG
jgi:hypothetical protein